MVSRSVWPYPLETSRQVAQKTCLFGERESSATPREPMSPWPAAASGSLAKGLDGLLGEVLVAVVKENSVNLPQGWTALDSAEEEPAFG